MARKTAAPCSAHEVLFLTWLTKLEVGRTTIAAKVERVCRDLKERPDIMNAVCIATSADRTSAFIVVRASRPSALKTLNGNDLPQAFRSFGSNDARTIARKYDPAFAQAAREWAAPPTASAPAATA